MRYPVHHKIFTDFDLTVILPFFRSFKRFARVLPLNAQYFQRNGIEVLIVLADDSEKEATMTVVKKYPLINWVVIAEQVRKNECKGIFINETILVSSKKFILVCDPVAVFHTDVIFRLRYMASAFESRFIMGKSIVNENSIVTDLKKNPVFSGPLLIQKDHMAKTGELLFAGEDLLNLVDNIRLTLEYHGIRQFYVDDATIMQEADPSLIVVEPFRPFRRVNKYKPVARRHGNGVLDPLTSVFNIYDYKNNSKDRKFVTSILQRYEKFEVCLDGYWKKNFQILVLVQTYNERHHMPEILTHLDNICDGIILLDDGSDDGTYELAMSNKLLLKVQKRRGKFDDLENRNLLLDLASFVNAEWLVFVDADERFDMRYNNLRKTATDTTADVISFWLVNSWDSTSMYRADIDDSGNYSGKGIFSRARMFRNNRGRVQIVLLDDRKLHFPVVPYDAHPYPSKILLIHYGLQDRNSRLRKCSFYKSEDNDQRELDKFYNYLLDENPELLPINTIQLND